MNVSLKELGLELNPLACNCSSKWIQRQMYREGGILGPLWDQIVCYDNKTGKQYGLANYTINGCGKWFDINNS